MQASTTINATGTQYVNRDETTTTARALQNALLSELPGVAFAVLTLVWVVSSLVRL